MESSSQTQLSQNVSKLMNPHQLTDEEIKIILRERGVGENLLTNRREQLIELFKNVALPLPQRVHRNNYRGNLLTELRRKKEERKRINVDTSDHEKSVSKD